MGLPAQGVVAVVSATKVKIHRPFPAAQHIAVIQIGGIFAISAAALDLRVKQHRQSLLWPGKTAETKIPPGLCSYYTVFPLLLTMFFSAGQPGQKQEGQPDGSAGQKGTGQGRAKAQGGQAGHMEAQPGGGGQPEGGGKRRQTR